ncbi:isochorismatase family protein, partial [bacterium]|nr:isochorismatase family protein [bacterium]
MSRRMAPDSREGQTQLGIWFFAFLWVFKRGRVCIMRSPAIMLCLTFAAQCVADANDLDQLKLTTRRIVKTGADQKVWATAYSNITWRASGTAVVICDMWDRHWCKGATERVAEMAPRMNQLASELRRRGALVIHCPSGTMNYYAGSPGRKLAASAPKVEPKVPLKNWCSLDPSKEDSLPIDDSDGGCDDSPACKQGSVWQHQIDAIRIMDGDAITDSSEAYNLVRQRGLTNIIVMGVHQNMCVLGRPFSIRQMVNQGLNVVLVRDMTDSMYNSRARPFVDHFTGNDLVTWHIEKFWCPTITSD